MKTTPLLCAFLLYVFSFSQQHVPLPRGKVYGTKPDITAVTDASHLETFMDKKTRISITIRGRVTRVTKQKGGWFEMDAGKGKVIAAHFRENNISIPAGLAGSYIIAEGVAEKQFIADDQQHFAGDTVKGKKQHSAKTDAKRRLTFEVKGLMVEK